MDSKLSIGGVFARIGALFGETAVPSFVVLGLLVALASSSDIFFGNVNFTVFPLAIVQLVGQYEVTRTALDRAGLLQPQIPSRRRYAALFGMGFLSGAGVLIGLVLLVLPGLYLLLRWSIAAPVLIAEGLGMSESLSASWQRTNGHLLPITGIFVLVPVALGAAVAVAPLLSPTLGHVAAALVTNLLIYGASLFGWLASVAIYAELTPRPQAALESVFA